MMCKQVCIIIIFLIKLFDSILYMFVVFYVFKMSEMLVLD